MKKFLYFQPEYVSRFSCTGGGICSNNCCERSWRIEFDAATCKKYSRIKPKDKAKEILSHLKFNAEKNLYVVTLEQKFDVKNLDDGRKIFSMTPELSCPFLTAEKLCRIQLEYGEDFLSQVCATYPRRTFSFGKFFERSLTLTCPVAAEMILFAKEPLKFEFVEVPEKIHSKHGRIKIEKFPVLEYDAELFLEIQVAMISILQTRKFSIDERLIILGFFCDKLNEMLPAKNETEKNDLLDLIAAYRSEEFLLEQMPPLLQTFEFDAKRFVTFMIKFIGHTLEFLRTKEGEKFFAAFEKVFGIKPDENDLVSLDELAANFEKLTDARKIFSEKYSTFLENYLVNEFFYCAYPWRFRDHSLTKNFAIFMISYKIFELVTFATTHSGLDSKADLLAMIDWFMMRSDHNPKLYERFLELLEGVDDTYLLMMTLL